MNIIECIIDWNINLLTFKDKKCIEQVSKYYRIKITKSCRIITIRKSKNRKYHKDNLRIRKYFNSYKVTDLHILKGVKCSDFKHKYINIKKLATYEIKFNKYLNLYPRLEWIYLDYKPTTLTFSVLKSLPNIAVIQFKLRFYPNDVIIYHIADTIYPFQFTYDHVRLCCVHDNSQKLRQKCNKYITKKRVTIINTNNIYHYLT